MKTSGQILLHNALFICMLTTFGFCFFNALLVYLYILMFSQGPYYEEFVKAATSDNEIQFVETNNVEVAKVLYPDLKAANHFLGFVKSEPERYTEYGE